MIFNRPGLSAKVAFAKPASRTISEDWLALIIGLSLFLVSLLGFSGVEVFGWTIKTNVWTRATEIMTPVSKNFPHVNGVTSLVFTYLFLLGTLTVTLTPAVNVRFTQFIIAFSLVFLIAYACYVGGNFAYVAATPLELKKFKIPWSLNLTGEAGFILALIAGLIIGNFFRVWSAR
jgi:hypothetical protein